MGRQIYVESLIRAPIERIWSLTQDPAEHQRWDLRFSEIRYEPLVGDEPRRFSYALRLPGRRIAGVGASIGEKQRPDGTRTSALKFWSDDPLSLIRSGSGYWRYSPAEGGVRFITGYDYVPGWGFAGGCADVLFRPVMGWMTAWSFDRLRLWTEMGIAPEKSRNRALIDLSARIALSGFAVALAAKHPPGAIAAVIGAVCLPRGKRIPRARRCLRRAPDVASGTPPSTLAVLEAS